MKTIEIEGIFLNVEYKYFAATQGSVYEPPEGETIEIISVTVDDTDILPLIEDRWGSKIEYLVLKDMADDIFSYEADDYDDDI